MQVNPSAAPTTPGKAVLGLPAERVLRYAWAVFAVISAGSAVTLVAAFVLQRVDPDLVNWVVWVRAGCYSVGGVWLLGLVRSARQAALRSSFTRLRAVAVLAPLGIAALVISPDSGYPGWMKIEQAAFGLLLVPLAVGLLRPSVAAEFPKTARRSTRSGS